MGEARDWYHDPATGVPEYVPMPGDRPQSAVVVAPQLAQIVQIAGDPRGGRPAGHIIFRGLTFAHSAWQLPRNGYLFCQAEALYPAAVTVTGAQRVRFEGCTFHHMGGYALEFGSADGEAVNCGFHDPGSGGVKIGTLRTDHPAGRCAVRNCRIVGGTLAAAGAPLPALPRAWPPAPVEPPPID